MISLRETARRHDTSAGYLSERVREEKPVKGHSLHQYAVVEQGKVQGFDFPTDYIFPVPSDNEQTTEQTTERANERRKNPGKRDVAEGNGFSSTTEIMADIDEQLRSGNERSSGSALKAAGMEGVSTLTDMLRENPGSLPLLADPAKHGATLGIGLLAGWWLNRRFASVSGTITGALLAATATDLFIRRDQSIVMGLFTDDKDEDTSADHISNEGMGHAKLLDAEDPADMIERIMRSAQSTTN